ncbi:hypothetical protein SAMN03159453_04927 [Pseudomonas sp. NFIX28]|nr:hypothetical protein SAMN03159453_04927 [Pseudomonas sp. NFIX28]
MDTPFFDGYCRLLNTLLFCDHDELSYGKYAVLLSEQHGQWRIMNVRLNSYIYPPEHSCNIRSPNVLIIFNGKGPTRVKDYVKLALGIKTAIFRLASKIDLPNTSHKKTAPVAYFLEKRVPIGMEPHHGGGPAHIHHQGRDDGVRIT